jgi:hypothetical protein
MFSIVLAALRSRRSSMIALCRNLRAQSQRPVHVSATDALAALCVGFAAAGPGCVAAFGRGHASAGLVAVATATTAVVVTFASMAIFLAGRIGRSVAPLPDLRLSRGRRGLPGRYGGCVGGATGGLAVGVVVASTEAADLVPITIGIGVASAAVAVAACWVAADLGNRGAARLRTATGFLGPTDLGPSSGLHWSIGLGGATDGRRARGWLVAAGTLVLLAVGARHAGPVGANLVPYVVAGAIACCAGGMLRPVARWIGCRAVRVTEFALDERPYVTVDGGGSNASEATARDGVRVDAAVDVSAAAARGPGRFVRGTIAATGYLARRPDLDRVVALAVAGVVIAGAATFAWTSGATARRDRAAIELGADRVLTVAPVPPAHLMADVRAADPTGRYAMAAVVASGTASGGPVVAVDGQRLGAVVSGGVRSGPTGKQLAALLRPARVPPTEVAGATLQLNVITSSTVGAAARVAVLLETPDEVTHRVEFGPLHPGEHVYAAAAPCPMGCTVKGFTVAGSLAPAQPVVSVILRELRQRTPDRAVLDPSAFADASRWRLGATSSSGAQTFAVSEAGLDIAVAGDTVPSNTDSSNIGPSSMPRIAGESANAVVYLDAEVSTSAITGPETATGEPYDLPSADAGAIKITRLGSPVPGVPEGGILVDLAAVVPPNAAATNEVWLATDAPASLVDELSRHGLRVVAQTSMGAREAVYADQPAVTVARLQLLAGIVVLCCAAVLIGAVTRAHRGAHTVARGIGLAIGVWTAGIGGGLVARHAGPDFATGFVDGWARLRPPPLVGSAPFAEFALASGLALAAAVAAAGARHRPRSGVVNPPGPARQLDGRVGAAGNDRRDLAVGGAHGTLSAT